MTTELRATVHELVQKGKGILAADESGPTIAKRFKAIGVESTEENRRTWRNLVLATPGLSQYVSGVILYEETLGQRADGGDALPQLAARQGIVPGIKVDCGKGPLALAPGRGDGQPGRAEPARAPPLATELLLRTCAAGPGDCRPGGASPPMRRLPRRRCCSAPG